jgi:hypothetical protein
MTASHSRGQYPGTPERQRRLRDRTGYCWASLRLLATAAGSRACELTDDQLTDIVERHKADRKTGSSARGRPRGPTGATRRSRAQIDRLEASTGYAWHTAYRVARSRGLWLGRMTESEIIAMLRWHTARCQQGTGCTRTSSSLRRVRCDYCGRASAEVGRTWRYDYDADAIVCARGEGCSRRRPEDERIARGRTVPTREYRDRAGYWHSIQQIADLAEITYPAAYQRMRSGWTVEDAIRPRESTRARPQYFSRLRRALDAAVKEAV